MFNAERVLGSLLSGVTGSRGGFSKASIGMGLVGLAGDNDFLILKPMLFFQPIIIKMKPIYII